MKLISFTYNYWQYPFFMSFFQFVQTFTGLYYKPNSLILTPILSALSHMLAFFQEDIKLFYEIRHFQKKYQKNKEKSSNITHILFAFSTIKLKNQNTMKISLLLLTLGLVNIFPHSLYMIYASIQPLGSFQSCINLFFTSIFCYSILKTKLYIHHYIAMFIFIIDISLYLGIRIDHINELLFDNFKGWGIFILISLFYIIPTSFREVLEKYLMQTFFISSSLILIFEGVFLLIVFILYFVIIQCVQCNNLSFLSTLCIKSQWTMVKKDIVFYFNYSSILTLFVWLYFFGVYLSSYFRIETINKLSPMHRFVGEMLFQVYWFIYNVSIGNEEIVIWLDLIQVVLLLFSSFLFNEVIIIQFCNLDYYTHLEISDRGINETNEGIEEIELVSCSQDMDF